MVKFQVSFVNLTGNDYFFKYEVLRTVIYHCHCMLLSLHLYASYSLAAGKSGLAPNPSQEASSSSTFLIKFGRGLGVGTVTWVTPSSFHWLLSLDDLPWETWRGWGLESTAVDTPRLAQLSQVRPSRLSTGPPSLQTLSQPPCAPPQPSQQPAPILLQRSRPVVLKAGLHLNKNLTVPLH